MNKRTILVLTLTVFLFSGQTPSPPYRATSDRDLSALGQRGFSYRTLNNDMIEVTDPLSGEKRLKSLREPSEAEIRSWAARRGIPILEIDPNTIDTSKYHGWYNYWTTVPLGNSFGNPLVVGDFNHNEQAEVYGAYKDSLSSEVNESRLYEIDLTGRVLLRHRYAPWPGISSLISDADADSLLEIDFSYYGVVSGYEQYSRDSLPIHRVFEHDRYYHNSSAGPSKIYMRDLDRDGFTDFLYQGTGPHPKDTNIAISKTYVAEYSPALQTFKRVWSTQFVPGSGAAGFSVGDFDGDGRMEFVATHGGSGRVFVAENAGDNGYALTYQDSTPFLNLYYHGSGDVDKDGTIEFFTGATMSNGNWVLVYEADSNDVYSAKLLFHLLSGGVFAEPIYVTADMDGDGKPELAMSVGSDLYVFKSNTDDEYYLWYFRREAKMEAIAFYDFNHDGKMDFIASKSDISSLGRFWLYADVYLATPAVSVSGRGTEIVLSDIELYPNYPNPFNPSTSIRFSLPSRQRVLIMIYDLLGRQVATLFDQTVERGQYTIEWNQESGSSGIYLCRLQTPTNVLTVKMLKLK